MELQDRKEIVENIQFLIEARDELKLKNFIVDTHPADLADILRDLDEIQRLYFFELVEPQTASLVLTELDDYTRNQLIEMLPADRLSQVIDEMASDDATDVVAELPDELKAKVLSRIDSQDRHEVEKLLVHDEETAGGIMALEFVAVYEDETVDDAIQEIRQKSQEVSQVYNVYAIDRGGRLVGLISLKKLILNNPKTLIRDIMRTDIVSVPIEMDQEEVAKLVRKYDLVSVPVVDKFKRLVGRITIDDIVDVLREEADEDLDRMAGIADEVLQETSTLRISRLRLPWLGVAFVGELVAAFVLSHFKTTFRQIFALTLFIPVIMAMGGNAGIQSSTIVVRSIALAEGGASDQRKRFLREIRVALLNGLVIGLLIFLAVFAWLRQPELGVLVAVAMIVVVVNASAVGAVVPYLLHRLKYDPAIATGPFITTTNDVVGLFIYLAMATLYLSWLD